MVVAPANVPKWAKTHFQAYLLRLKLASAYIKVFIYENQIQ